MVCPLVKGIIAIFGSQFLGTKHTWACAPHLQTPTWPSSTPGVSPSCTSFSSSCIDPFLCCCLGPKSAGRPIEIAFVVPQCASLSHLPYSHRSDWYSMHIFTPFPCPALHTVLSNSPTGAGKTASEAQARLHDPALHCSTLSSTTRPLASCFSCTD